MISVAAAPRVAGLRPFLPRSFQVLWLLLASCAISCTGTPDRVADLGTSDLAPGGETSAVKVIVNRPFGPEGEIPTHLLSTDADSVVLLTQKAIYRLDAAGRVVNRLALPKASSGAVVAPTSAAWDGTGLGATLRWGQDTKTPAGTYLALTDGDGAFTAASMLSLGSPSTVARTTWDEGSGKHLVLTAEPDGTEMDLALRQVSRTKGAGPEQVLHGNLSSSITIGDWIGPASRPALCTVELGGRALLRTFSAKDGAGAVDLTDQGRSALGSCRLASSGRSFLAIWVQQALPVTELDAGPAGNPDDLGPGSLSFNVPVIQLVDPDGKLALSPSLRLSSYPGTVIPETAVWDGRRYLIFARTAYRGGRLELTALDETGTPLFRELQLPLSYEPGALLGAKLAVGAGGDYWVVYALRRPHDGGVMYLVRFQIN